MTGRAPPARYAERPDRRLDSPVPRPRTGRVAVPLAAVASVCVSWVGVPARAGTAGCEPLLVVRFVEGAPRDRFELEAGAALEGTVATVEIGLDGAAGGLVFDTEPGGGGVEVFQPFRVEDASAGVSLAPDGFEGDGARVLALALEGFGPGASATFSIDIDDDLVDSVRGRTQVVGAEIAGATVNLTTLAPSGERRSAASAFDGDAVARVCV